MEPKPFGFHRTEAANNQIEQGDALFFARNPIGITYNQVIAMFTDLIHIASFGMLRVREERLSDFKLARGVGTNGVLAREFTLFLTGRDFCLILDSF
jgi:hypothetical protein